MNVKKMALWKKPVPCAMGMMGAAMAVVLAVVLMPLLAFGAENGAARGSRQLAASSIDAGSLTGDVLEGSSLAGDLLEGSSLTDGSLKGGTPGSGVEGSGLSVLSIGAASDSYDISSGPIVIKSANKNDYDGKTITGMVNEQCTSAAFSDAYLGSNGQRGAIIVDGVTVNLTISNLSVTATTAGGENSTVSPILLVNGATLNLTVENINALQAAYGGAGICVPQGCTLTINGVSTGTLVATGGDFGPYAQHGYAGGAGIGGAAKTKDGVEPSVGTITIAGGTIIANGGGSTNYGAAGIGGSSTCSAGTISITGGTVNATGGIFAAGIGNGINGEDAPYGGSVSISGGTVSTTGGESAAGIGGGAYDSVNTISITGGEVSASSSRMVCALGSGYGREYMGTVVGAPNVSITGGNVSATGNIGHPTTGDYTTGGSFTLGDSANVSCTGEVTYGSATKHTINVTVYDPDITIALNGQSATLTLGSSVPVSGTASVTTPGVATFSVQKIVDYGSADTKTVSTTAKIGDTTFRAASNVLMKSSKTCSVYVGYRLHLTGTIFDGGIQANQTGTMTINGTDVGATITCTQGKAVIDGWLSVDENGGVTDGSDYSATVAVTINNTNFDIGSVAFKKTSAHQKTGAFQQGEDSLDYVDENGAPQTATGFTRLENSMTTFDADKWYTVFPGETITLSQSLAVGNNVHLILGDGATFNANAGVVVNAGSKLTIYSQSANTGVLNATGANSSAGIGGGSGQSAGAIEIYGGTIKATATVAATGGSFGAGIGSGYYGAESDITINGGTVNATGGNQGAGIGQGQSSNNISASAGSVIIKAGDITAKGGNRGPGIGCGDGSHNLPYINISGGKVDAIAGDSAAGIGYGAQTNNHPSDLIVISGGQVTASSINVYNGRIHLSWTNRLTDYISCKGGYTAYNNSNGFGVVLDGEHPFMVQGTGVRAVADKDTTNFSKAIIVPLLTATLQPGEDASGSEQIDDLTRGGSYTVPECPAGDTITATCGATTCDLPDRKTTLTIVAPKSDLTYDGTEKPVTLTGDTENLGTPTISYTKDGAAYTGAPKDAGTYVASITLSEGSGAATASVTYIIKPKNVSIAGLTVYNGIYNGTTTAEFESKDAAVVGKVGNDDVTPKAGAASFDTADVGTNKHVYFTGWSLAGSKASNYQLAGQPASTTASISQRAITITAKPQTVEFGSSIQTGASWVDVSGNNLANGQRITAITLSSGENSTIGEHENAITPSEAIIQDDAGNTLTSNYAITYASGKLTVTKAKAKVTTAPAAKQLTYTGQSQNLVTEGVAVTSMEYVLGSDATTAPTDGWSASVPAHTKAGDYVVWYRAVADNDHVASDPVPLSAPIGKAKLTVTAKPATITYGDAPTNDGVTYSGFVNGETEDVLGGTLGYDYTYAQYGNAGSYTITPKGLTADNYEFSYVQGTLTVIPLFEPVKTYTVKFVDGQGKTLKTQKVEHGKPATAPADPKRSGYTFAGWDKSFGKVTADMTVTAQWKKAGQAAKSATPFAKMTSKGKSDLSFAWEAVEGADGYDVFFSRCDHGGKRVALKRVAVVKAGGALTWEKSGLKRGTSFKARVKAYVVEGGKKRYIGSSPLVHAYTAGGKYANAKAVKLNRTRVSLGKGKSFKLKASVTKQGKGKKLMPVGHVARVRYLSTDKRVVTVTAKGKIRARGKGVCYVYAYAHNGASKKVKVTVK